MSAVNDDIRADFLIEAGDLVERLGGELVELESRPQDTDLLNSIFRAFHTVKGGAGFLQVTPLVDVCHVTEDLFNALRSGKRAVDADLMDGVMQALDQVQAMMASLREGAEPAPAPAELIARLKGLLNRAPAPAPDAAKPVAAAAAVSAPAASPSKLKANADSEAITDDEFDALLDELHGAGKGPSAAPAPSAAPDAAGAAGSSETISEDEFDALLDQLHGKNKAPVAAATPTPTPTVAAATPGPTPTPKPAAPNPAASAQKSEPSAAKPAASSAPPAETSVRVDTTKLDRMMNLVGELVLVRNRLKALAPGGGPDVARAVQELDFITRGLQGSVMQVRMQPVGKVFSRFPKLARDVARGLNKQVEVVLVGQDTDLDKNLVEALGDPLVHMVRNSIDHGIEMPDVRVARGKPAAGTLRIEARQEGDHIRITVRDDGAGIDPDRIREKAVEKGLVDIGVAERMTRDERLQLIFLPGFSTKEQVSDLSGRGVGMDVVKSRIQSLNGTVHIESQPGHGTSIHLRVPLTLAILPALMVDAGKRQFALPLATVADVFALDQAAVRKVGPWNVVPLKRENLRLIDLEDWAGAADKEGTRHVVVVMIGEERFGFIVRQVRGREEVVIKPLGASLRGLAGVAGATVTPQGHVALIVDVPGLVQAHYRTA